MNKIIGAVNRIDDPGWRISQSALDPSCNRLLANETEKKSVCSLMMQGDGLPTNVMGISLSELK
jgi:hypothetical protein